jgi:hypothetical protein
MAAPQEMSIQHPPGSIVANLLGFTTGSRTLLMRKTPSRW